MLGQVGALLDAAVSSEHVRPGRIPKFVEVRPRNRGGNRQEAVITQAVGLPESWDYPLNLDTVIGSLSPAPHIQLEDRLIRA